MDAAIMMVSTWGSDDGSGGGPPLKFPWVLVILLLLLIVFLVILDIKINTPKIVENDRLTEENDMNILSNRGEVIKKELLQNGIVERGPLRIAHLRSYNEIYISNYNKSIGTWKLSEIDVAINVFMLNAKDIK